MVRDAAATRTRILGAAVTEFAAVGFAGARIDRIADMAEANKRMIYVYFTDKERLFQAALDHVIRQMVETVPVSEDAIPEYAGALFDYLGEHPEALRLSLWRQLESPGGGPQLTEVYAEKVTAMSLGTPAAGRDGVALTPVDLLVLAQGMAAAWWNTPADLLAAEGAGAAPGQRLAQHRAALVEAVRRIVEPWS